MNARLKRLLTWRPHIILNGDPRAAFNIAADAAKPGARTFHAFGLTVHWTFVGFIVCRHSDYLETDELMRRRRAKTT